LKTSSDSIVTKNAIEPQGTDAPEVQSRLVHRNHVIWRTKITKFWRNGNDSKQRIECALCVSGIIFIRHTHSQKIVKPNTSLDDFDGLIGIELPVSMYTTKTPIDMCRFNVRSLTLKNLNIFCKRQISIKLFYLYQKLQCRDKYFFKSKLIVCNIQ
jgi:hypothetical protein